MGHRIPLNLRLGAGEAILGMTVQLTSTDIVELVALAGYDFVMIDAEHGALDVPAVARLILAADARGLAAMVRVPDSTPSFISRVMDAGAAGVVVPNVRTRQQAQEAVNACHLPPIGRRGACATARAADFGSRAWNEYAEAQPRESMVWLLIEDAQGLDHVEEILSVSGIAAVGLGAFDLAQSLGVPGQMTHKQVRAGFDRLNASARTRGIPMLSVPAAEPGGVQGAMRRGARVLLDGFDAQLILAAFRERRLRIHEAFTS